MSYSIRRAERGDVSRLVKLLENYLRETYGGEWAGTAERLERDIFSGEFEMLIAENRAGEIIGFIAWNSTYDLHHCLKGGTIIDFYVAPSNRGRGAGLLLATEAAEIEKSGGAFLHGGAVESETVRRFYNRIAMNFPNGECYVSGRAFRHLASLADKPVREIIRNLPETAWNYQS